MSSGCECGCKSHVRSCETEFQYAVKVVSGVIPGRGPGPTQGPPNPVAPGHYYTAINVHNPAKCGCVTFRVKVAQALPWENIESKVGRVTNFASFTLCADEALEIDNPQILKPFSPLPFVKGYVVIESPEELDVVAVYTVAQDYCGPCHSLYTERVPPRCVPVCEDLVLPINTGVADWQTVSVLGHPISPSRPVVDLAPYNSAWSAPPSGSTWVSSAASDVRNARAGQYIYQLIFDLCSGFSDPILHIDGLADNRADIFLNGHSAGAFHSFTAISSLTVPPANFVPGKNILQAVVTNSPGSRNRNPTGFAISGLLRVTRGRCPCAKLPLLPPRLEQPVRRPEKTEEPTERPQREKVRRPERAR